MRILLVNDYSTPGGGAEHQMLTLRAGLRRRGHQVRLLSSDASLVAGETIEADLAAAGRTDLTQVLSQTANLSAWRAVRNELQANPPDIVHIRMFLWQLSPLILQPMASVPVLFQAAVYKAICPAGLRLLPDGTPCHHRAGVVCFRQGCVKLPTWLSTMAQLQMLARWRDRLDCVAVLSERMRQEFARNGWESRVLGNGVDLPDELAQPGPHPTIGFAGRLAKEKGLDVLLEAFEQVSLRLPDARLLIAGAGPEEQRLRARATTFGERVQFLGHVPREKLAAAFQDLWVQVVPSLWHEPFGNVSTEAMARGTAVVASDVGGQSDIVRDDVCGYLVPPNDAGALADALSRILTDCDLATQLGAEGRRIAASDYAWEPVLDRLEACYRCTIEAFATRTRKG